MLQPGDRALAEHASKHYGVFSIDQALDAGLSRAQVHRRSNELWLRIHEGIFRLPGVPTSWRAELYAACLAAPSPSAGSHRSASALYGLPGARDKTPEITCRRWRRTQRAGLIVHESTRFDDCDITMVDGIAVVTAERLLFDLASIWPSANFIEKVVHAARRKQLITFASATQTFDRLARRGIRGVDAVRIALDRWNPRVHPTESDMETLLIQVLREHGLPEPVAQFEVRDEEGQFVARTDAALPTWRITFEYQSKQEHSNEFQLLRDDRRRNAIIAAGYHPLSARHEDLCAGGDKLVAEVRRLIRRLAS